MSRGPVIITVIYLAIVTGFLVLALINLDEFGYSFIPAFYATFPWSQMLCKRGTPFCSPPIDIVVGGIVNAAILYWILKVFYWVVKVLIKRKAT